MHSNLVLQSGDWGKKGNAIQTQYKPNLLVEKGKKVGTGGQVNRVSPALDLLASQYKVAIPNKNGTKPDILF